MTSRNCVSLKSNVLKVSHTILEDLISEYGDRASKAEDKKRTDFISTLSSTPVSSHFIRYSMYVYLLTSVRFREAIHSGDYFSAVKHIHSYFDHSITMQGQQQETPYIIFLSCVWFWRKTYQFALLYLAILHEQFHNYSDAAWVSRNFSDSTYYLGCSRGDQHSPREQWRRKPFILHCMVTSICQKG